MPDELRCDAAIDDCCTQAMRQQILCFLRSSVTSRKIKTYIQLLHNLIRLFKVLYLIGYALNEELRPKDLTTMESDPAAPFVFSTKAVSWRDSSLLESLQNLVGLPQTQQFSNLIQWTIAVSYCC